MVGAVVHSQQCAVLGEGPWEGLPVPAAEVYF